MVVQLLAVVRSNDQQRVIQQRIQNPLATEILKGNLPAGSGVKIDFVDDEFVFTPIAPRQNGNGNAGKSSRRKPRGGTEVETVGVK